MIESLRSFLIIMRNLIRLRGAEGKVSFAEVLTAFEQQFQCAFPITSSLLRIKLSQSKWNGDLETTFEKYCQELEQLVHVIDNLPLKPRTPTDQTPSHQP
jgi:hypothetical protein